MKIKFNEKYNTIAIYSLIVMIAGILLFQYVENFARVNSTLNGIFKIFKPLIIGFVMAYVFNFILVFFEEKILDRIDNKIVSKNQRTISIALTYLTVGILVYLFIVLIFPQIIESITGIVNNIPEYIELTTRQLLELEDLVVLDENITELMSTQIEDSINKVVEFMTNLVPLIWVYLRRLIVNVWNIVIGVIISIYLLIDKERFMAIVKKTVIGITSESASEFLINITRRADTIFSGFLWGKVIDSIIVAILLFISMSIFKVPYKMLLAFIVGFTNIIPFFGPFIGAIPGIIILLFENPIKALTFVILIVVIQQIDGNIIGPRILGSSIGISPFWILLSLLIMGDLLGIIGLIIGVPLFALIYSIIKDLVEARLDKKGLPKETSSYMNEE